MLERWATFIASVTAIVSLLIATLSYLSTSESTQQQLEMTRLHNELSVKPVIDTFVRADPTGNKAGFGLRNVGIGPAEVQELRHAVDGDWIDTRTPA